MRSRILLILLPALALLTVLVSAPSQATPTGNAQADNTPATCDAKTVSHHRHRSRVIIKQAYDLDRYPDKTPAKASEKDAWREHKLCIAIESVRGEIAEYQDSKSKKYDKAYRNNWCSLTPHPEGSGCWEIPTWCVEAESGGSWEADNPTSDARGAYQLLGHGEPWPVDSRSDAMKHHRIAAGLYASSGLGPWEAC